MITNMYKLHCRFWLFLQIWKAKTSFSIFCSCNIRLIPLFKFRVFFAGNKGAYSKVYRAFTTGRSVNLSVGPDRRLRQCTDGAQAAIFKRQCFIFYGNRHSASFRKRFHHFTGQLFICLHPKQKFPIFISLRWPTYISNV